MICRFLLQFGECGNTIPRSRNRNLFPLRVSGSMQCLVWLHSRLVEIKPWEKWWAFVIKLQFLFSLHRCDIEEILGLKWLLAVHCYDNFDANQHGCSTLDGVASWMHWYFCDPLIGLFVYWKSVVKWKSRSDLIPYVLDPSLWGIKKCRTFLGSLWYEIGT